MDLSRILESSSPDRAVLNRLLAVDYLRCLRDLDDSTLVEDRYASFMAESELSYVRRMLQGRLDLLKFEAGRRREGGRPQSYGSDKDLVNSLAKVLTGGSDSVANGCSWDPVSTQITGDLVADYREQAEEIVSDVRVSDVRNLSDEELETALRRLSTLESAVSQARSQCQLVADAVAAEVSKRADDAAND